MHRVLLLLALTLLTATCTRPLAEAPLRPDPAFAPPERLDLPGLSDDPAAPFTLLAGDEITLKIASIEPLDLPRLAIDAQNLVYVPLVGAVEVGGLSPAAAEQQVEASYRRYDRFARVSLLVHEAKGHRATVIGAVNKPGSFPLGADTRVVELLALAGGATSTTSEDGQRFDAADLGAARVVRTGEPLPVSIRRAMQGDARHNVLVRAGDVLYVPATHASRVSVLGHVGRPRALTYRAGLRLTEALALAGGPTRDADAGDVRVVRGSLEAPRVYRASLRDLMRGAGRDVELAPGDVVFVTEHWLATTSELIGRLTPALAIVSLGAVLAP